MSSMLLMLMEFTSEISKENCRNCVKKKISGGTYVLFDITVNLFPFLQMQSALKNLCTVFIEYFYLWSEILLKKTQMICYLALNHRWKEMWKVNVQRIKYIVEKNYQQKMEMKWKSDKTGKRRKSREEGARLDVVMCYECAKEHNSLILCDTMCDCANARVGCHLVAVDSAWKWLYALKSRSVVG